MINATGPHTDFIRTMDNPNIKRICQPSSGVHIVLPDYYRWNLVSMVVSLFYIVPFMVHLHCLTSKTLPRPIPMKCVQNQWKFTSVSVKVHSTSEHYH